MSTTPPTLSALRYAWFAVILLVPVALLNYLDRQMLATMKASMVADIPSIGNKADWGLVLGCFKWTYAVLSPFGGWVADRLSRRYVIGLSLLVWSAVTWRTGYVTTFQELVWLRSLMGISEAFYIPAALAMITDFHTGSTRSRAVGVHQAGIYLGQILGSFAGYVAESPDLGWRWMFHTCGMVGVIYALPLLWLLRNPARHSVDSAPKKPAFAGLSGLLSDRNYVLLVLYFTLPAIAGWIVRDWMPEILRERFSLGQGRAGVSAILFVQIASIVGVIVGGSLADRWMQHSQRGRIFTSAIGMMMFLPALFLIGNSWTLSVAIVGLVIFGVGWGFFDCNNMPILCQIARPESRATGYGIMNLVSISCGGFGDWVFGWLQDQGIPINATFGVFAGVALLSVVIVLLIRPKPDREVASGTN
jgi:MFS family permease